MKFLDTDTLSLLSKQQSRVTARFDREQEELAITIVTRIEVLLGRFEFILKAADGEQLQRAVQHLVKTELDLSNYKVVTFDSGSAAEFDRLRADRKLKNI